MITARRIIPLSIRNRLRSLLYQRRAPAPSPVDVVKANTQEAFEYFYTQDKFLAENYLEPERIALYQLVARRCSKLITAQNHETVARICDVGCGTGEMLEILKSSLPPGYPLELSGLDFASSAIAKARKLLPGAALSVGDIYANDLPTGCFDLVLCLETLEHLKRPEKALATLLRICRPGGVIVITVPNGDKDSWEGHINFWNASQFAAFLSPAGAAQINLVQDEITILAVLSKSENAGHESKATDCSSH